MEYTDAGRRSGTCERRGTDQAFGKLSCRGVRRGERIGVWHKRRYNICRWGERPLHFTRYAKQLGDRFERSAFCQCAC